MFVDCCTNKSVLSVRSLGVMGFYVSKLLNKLSELSLDCDYCAYTYMKWNEKRHLSGLKFSTFLSDMTISPVLNTGDTCS